MILYDCSIELYKAVFDTKSESLDYPQIIKVLSVVSDSPYENMKLAVFDPSHTGYMSWGHT